MRWTGVFKRRGKFTTPVFRGAVPEFFWHRNRIKKLKLGFICIESMPYLFPSCIAKLISEYVGVNLHSWIDRKIIYWGILSSNVRAMPFLAQHVDEIEWGWFSTNVGDGSASAKEIFLKLIKSKCEFPLYTALLSSNPMAAEFLISRGKNTDINTFNFSGNSNPVAINYIREHLHGVNWRALSSNPSAFDLLMQHSYRIRFDEFSKNTSDDAVEYLIKNPLRIRWSAFSKNSNSKAVTYMLAHPKKIVWRKFSGNPNPIAVKSMKTRNNFHKYIVWPVVIGNPGADEKLLEKALRRTSNKNFLKIKWEAFYRNPAALPIIKKIFTLTKKEWFEYPQYWKIPLNEAHIYYNPAIFISENEVQNELMKLTV